jgi:hypothetical protein
VERYRKEKKKGKYEKKGDQEEEE